MNSNEPFMNINDAGMVGSFSTRRNNKLMSQYCNEINNFEPPALPL